MSTKTLEEVKAITLVQQATEAAMVAVVAYIHDSSQPSAEVAHQIIDTVLAAHQCESPEGHIVASGKQSFVPHEHGTGPLLLGEPIVIDIYPRSKITGWWGDMSRTVCFGEPSSELLRMYEVVREAKRMAIAMARPGVSGQALYRMVQDYFVTMGYETNGQGEEFKYYEGFVHSLGHGLGQAVHESPRLGEGSDDVLQVGDVITIEPGLYYKDIGGVRLEDLLIVTDDGVQNLNTFPESLRLTER